MQNFFTVSLASTPIQTQPVSGDQEPPVTTPLFYPIAEDALEIVLPQHCDQIQMGIDQVNSDKFNILAASRFKNLSSYVQYVSINEEHDHILLTCNDRALRLYHFDYKALSKALNKDEG